MPGKAKGERVLGPYRVGKRWQVIHVGPGADGGRVTRYFATEVDAARYRDILLEQVVVAATTIDEALDQYERHLITKGNKERSWKETLRRLRRFFPDRGERLDMLNRGLVEGWYKKLVETPVPVGKPKVEEKPDGTKVEVPAPLKPMSADSHRNYLAEAKTFLSWCVEQRWMSVNPLEGVKGVGRRRHGKPQLRIDEARKWMAKAVEIAKAGEEGWDGAVAALMTLLLGMRASEVVSRQVRDVDDAGRLLWIPDSKTDAGRRTLEVPEMLRPFLVELAQGRGGEELLFRGKTGPGRGRAPHRDRKWPLTWVKKIAELAGVPLVTAHGMRGLHATLALEHGATGHIVASALGHESFVTTATSYAKPEAVDAAARRKGLKVLDGGK